jgi:hypothetical protein
MQGRKENTRTENKKKILPINSINTVIHYTSTKASSRRSEIGRTSISGSFSLLLSFGDAKERRERNLSGVKAYHSFLFLEKKKRSKRKFKAVKRLLQRLRLAAW